MYFIHFSTRILSLSKEINAYGCPLSAAKLFHMSLIARLDASGVYPHLYHHAALLAKIVNRSHLNKVFNPIQHFLRTITLILIPNPIQTF